MESESGLRMRIHRHRARREVGVLAAAAAMILMLPAQGIAPLAIRPSGAPASPTSVVLAPGSKSLRVAWAESSSGAIVYTATATSPGRVSGLCITTTQNCTIAALDNGVVYDVAVVARSALDGSSAPSVEVSTNVGVPGPPRSVHTRAGVAQTTVYWSAPRSNGVPDVSGYVATASPGGFSCSTAGTIVTKPARTCEIPGLTSGGKYTVTVTASNEYGSGAPSSLATVTTT